MANSELIKTLADLSEKNGAISTKLNELKDCAHRPIESTEPDPFPEIRDNLSNSIQEFLDILNGDFNNELGLVSDEFVKQVLDIIALPDDESLSPEVLARTEEWVEPGEDVGYVSIPDILRNLQVIENPNLTYIHNIFITSKENLYVPTILANTVAYRDAIVNSGTYDDVVEALSVLKITRDTNLSACVGKYEEYLEAITSPQLATIMVATMGSDRETAISGIETLVSQGKALIDSTNKFLNYVKSFAGYIDALEPKLKATLNTVIKAYSLYKKHLAPGF